MNKKLGRPATGQTPVRTIRVDDQTWERWKAAANAAGLSLTEWIKRKCGA